MIALLLITEIFNLWTLEKKKKEKRKTKYRSFQAILIGLGINSYYAMIFLPSVSFSEIIGGSLIIFLILSTQINYWTTIIVLQIYWKLGFFCLYTAYYFFPPNPLFKRNLLSLKFYLSIIIKTFPKQANKTTVKFQR